MLGWDPHHSSSLIEVRGAVHPPPRLDAQIVNVALSAIRDFLGGGLSGLQWVVTGHTLMFASLQVNAR